MTGYGEQLRYVVLVRLDNGREVVAQASVEGRVDRGEGDVGDAQLQAAIEQAAVDHRELG